MAAFQRLALACSLALTVSDVALATDPGPARDAAPPLADQLPYAQRLFAGGLGAEPSDALAKDIDQLLTRLLLDDEDAAVDRATDLHALILLAAEVDLLQRRGEATPALRRTALATAYLLHLVGFAYETRPAVRAALEGLPEQVAPEQREGAEALLDAVRRMRRVGGAWFARALPAVLRDAPQDPAVQTQRGLWLEREGRPADAAEAFALAFRASQQPRHALHLYEALLAADQDREADALAQRLGAASPALRQRLDRRRRDHDDRRATVAFERPPRTTDAAVQREQLLRYGRLGRQGASILLAKELEEARPSDGASQHAIAMVWFGTRRFEALAKLLERAAAAGPLDDRLLEARVALGVQRSAPGVRTADGHGATRATLDADLATLAARGGEQDRLIGHAARILLPLQEWQAALAAGAEVAELGVVRRLEDAANAGLADLPRSRDMRLLALAAYVGLNRAGVGITRVSENLEALASDDRRVVGLLLAQVEAGYGVRRRDAQALERAAERLDALAKVLPEQRPEGFDEAAWRYTRAVVPVARQVLEGQSLSEAAATAALAALPRPGIDFNPEDAAGRLWEAALAATRGTLLLVLDRREAGVAALAGVRRVAPDEPVAKLVAAQIQLMIGDDAGASELLHDGLAAGLRPAEAFLYRKWRATCAHLLGQPEVERAEAREMLALWDEAKIPEVVATRSPRPLFIGAFRLGLELMPGDRLRVAVQATPIVLLVPDAPETRAEVQGRAQQAPVGAP